MLQNFFKIAIVIGAALGLLAISQYNYILFHISVELFSIIIGAGIFIVAYNTRKFHKNSFLVFIGIAFLFTGIIDFIHTLSYSGTGILSDTTNPNVATALWLIARFIQAISLLVAPFFLLRKSRLSIIFAAYFIIVSSVLFSLYAGFFPITFIPGAGLTQFKIMSEYAIAVILMCASIHFIIKRANIEKQILPAFLWSIAAAIASELTFTLYVDIYGILNATGHTLKVVSFSLIYAAFIKMNVTRPFESLYDEIQKRKQNEDALKKSEAHLLLEVSRMPIGYVIWDRNFRVTSWNPKAEEIFGYTFKEARGKHPYDIIVPKEEQPHIDKIWSRLLKGDITSHSVNKNTTKDGRTIICEWTNTPLIQPDGSITGVMSMVQDITERTAAEAKTEKTRQDLLSLASHQLRTPLSGTKWLIETLRRGIHGTLTPGQQEYLNELYKINERMISLVHDMLGALRIESGMNFMKKERTRVSSIFNALTQVLRPVAEERKIKLQFIEVSDRTITTDPTALKNILEVLISNAINYSPSENTIIVSAKDKLIIPADAFRMGATETEELIISVKDFGIGIPKDEQGKLFERFYRATNAKTFDPRGSGLGLYTAAMLAKNIGAKISFESEVGKGSTFFVHIPITPIEVLPGEDTFVYNEEA